MRDKGITWLGLPGAVLILLMANICLYAAPLELGFTYNYSQASVDVETEVYGDNGDMGSDYNDDPTYASAYADATGHIDDPGGSGGYDVFAETFGDAMVDYAADSGTGYVEFSSELSADGSNDSPYGSYHRAETVTLLQGTLNVGTSSSFPAGAGGLSLEINADEISSGQMFDGDWYVHLTSDDSANPIDFYMDWGTTTDTVDVLAGQKLEVEYQQDRYVESYDDYIYAESQFTIGFTVVPEPATVLLLTLGTLLLKKRRP